jgi:hypothetical protein
MVQNSIEAITSSPGMKLKDREKSFIGFFGNPTNQITTNESPIVDINSNTGTINRPGRVTNPNQVSSLF